MGLRYSIRTCNGLEGCTNAVLSWRDIERKKKSHDGEKIKRSPEDTQEGAKSVTTAGAPRHVML